MTLLSHLSLDEMSSSLRGLGFEELHNQSKTKESPDRVARAEAEEVCFQMSAGVRSDQASNLV